MSPCQKNVNYSRNVEGRLASTIHRLNNGTDKSTEQKLEAVGVKLSQQSQDTLKQIAREADYHKDYAKRPGTIQKQLVSKHQRLRDHIDYKQRHSVKSDYRKGQLDMPGTSKGDNWDHGYSQ